MKHYFEKYPKNIYDLKIKNIDFQRDCDVLKKISNDYNAPYEVVKGDVEKLIEKMRNHNLIEE